MASTAVRSSPSGNGLNKSQKSKRKEQHPVRKEFVEVGTNRYRCVHCDWSTVLNATRMIKHIIDICNCPDELKQDMVALQQAAAEKEQNSFMASENKKDIHGLFNIVENNKRSCKFCEWSTVRNLTRMRAHIVIHCQKVPVKIRSCFLKQEFKDESQLEGQGDQETYQVFEIEEADRGWEESTTVELVNDDDDEDENKNQFEDKEQLEDTSEFNYVEIQELVERQCSWCGSVLNYDSGEIETGSEIFCSSECFKNQTQSMRKEVKHVPPKRPAPITPAIDESTPKQKKIKVLMVTQTAPSPKATSVTLKKEPETPKIQSTRKANQPPPTPEEHDDEEETEQEEEEEEDEDFPSYSLEEEEEPVELPPPKLPRRKVVTAVPELKRQKQQQQQQPQQPKGKVPTVSTKKAAQTSSTGSGSSTPASTAASKPVETTEKPAVPEKVEEKKFSTFRVNSTQTTTTTTIQSKASRPSPFTPFCHR